MIRNRNLQKYRGVLFCAALALAGVVRLPAQSAEDLRLTAGKSVIIEYPSDVASVSTSTELKRESGQDRATASSGTHVPMKLRLRLILALTPSGTTETSRCFASRGMPFLESNSRHVFIAFLIRIRALIDSGSAGSLRRRKFSIYLTFFNRASSSVSRGA